VAGLFRGSVMLLALLLSAPTLWSAFVDHQISANTALIRLLIAIPAAAILLGALRWVMASHNNSSESARRGDQPPS
jgi:hypothetical protein